MRPEYALSCVPSSAMTTAFQGGFDSRYLLALANMISATVAALIVAHLLALAITGFRLVHRYSITRRTGNDGFWSDDFYAAVTSCGGLYILGVLMAIGESLSTSVSDFATHEVTSYSWTSSHAA